MQKRHFSKQNWHSDDCGLRIPVIQKVFYRKCATSVVERVALLRYILPIWAEVYRRPSGPRYTWLAYDTRCRSRARYIACKEMTWL